MTKSNGTPKSNGQGDWRSDPSLLFDLVERGLKEAVAAAIEDHRRAGNPVAQWRDGRVVLVHPDGSVHPVEETPATER